MKQSKLMSMLVLGLLMLLLAACGGEEAGTGSEDATNEDAANAGEPTDTYSLDMSVTTGESSTWFLGGQKFAEELSDRTDGRFEVNVVADEQLSGGNQQTGVEMLLRGNTDISYHSTIIYSIIDERFGIPSAPFLYNDLEEVDASLSGEAGEALNEILRDVGVEPLGFGENGFRQITNSERPIESVEDMKDLKIRVPGISMYIDLYRALGADPTSMAFAEVFTSLQQGTIDGQENPVDVIHSTRLNEVQDYLTLWNYSYDPLVLGVNKELFDSLHPADQEAMREAAEVANAYQIEITREREAELQEELESLGMEIVELDDESVAEFREAVEVIYEEYESVWGSELLETFRN
ncbi:DctP family TRAP transporter solute-binding subunit [Desertibacillus haloalkaliphilus]|uniref:DctP family TRAP transporter solute-binding subunit n=1 Tax=Desertibacillus haloalkaliphilus TaxID=1328930 RepID=UPI001C26D9C5|nr:DctP family TRAP transporter solute-binding subunit [Desertibacillus haloalkaliphilus]MBU8907977.1 DctP family TRAP transporter solute-binding subunit [Desertibacillus haloalkaliphilus]